MEKLNWKQLKNLETIETLCKKLENRKTIYLNNPEKYSKAQYDNDTRKIIEHIKTCINNIRENNGIY